MEEKCDEQSKRQRDKHSITTTKITTKTVSFCILDLKWYILNYNLSLNFSL